MLAQLTATFRQSGVRRAMSMLCAVAFLVFTFAHATHLCGSIAESPMQVELAALDGSSDGPDNTSGCKHCCSCSTAVMTVAETALLAIVPATRVETTARRTPHPYSLPADIRPPIA